LIAARDRGADELRLSHSILRAIWCDDRNIADWQVLASIAREAGHDDDLVDAAKKPAVLQQHRLDTAYAIEHQVFGAPTYVIDGERFWGQDRLDFLEEKLSSDTNAACG
jgi:2-hydroxychromene-2-carboxylate isomerase